MSNELSGLRSSRVALLLPVEFAVDGCTGDFLDGATSTLHTTRQALGKVARVDTRMQFERGSNIACVL